jgi:hypothetical protein
MVSQAAARPIRVSETTTTVDERPELPSDLGGFDALLHEECKQLGTLPGPSYEDFCAAAERIMARFKITDPKTLYFIFAKRAARGADRSPSWGINCSPGR